MATDKHRIDHSANVRELERVHAKTRSVHYIWVLAHCRGPLTAPTSAISLKKFADIRRRLIRESTPMTRFSARIATRDEIPGEIYQVTDAGLVHVRLGRLPDEAMRLFGRMLMGAP